ncbi:MAG: hypothetical protein ACTHJX_02785 [Terriglobales bacterium]
MNDVGWLLGKRAQAKQQEANPYDWTLERTQDHSCRRYEMPESVSGRYYFPDAAAGDPARPFR